MVVVCKSKLKVSLSNPLPNIVNKLPFIDNFFVEEIIVGDETIWAILVWMVELYSLSTKIVANKFCEEVKFFGFSQIISFFEIYWIE